MLQQCGERLVVGCLILPASQVADLTLAQTFGPDCIAFQDSVIKTNGEENLLSSGNLFVQSDFHFLLHPVAPNSVLGKNEQEFFMQVDGLFNTTHNGRSSMQIERGEPSAHSLF